MARLPNDLKPHLAKRNGEWVVFSNLLVVGFQKLRYSKAVEFVKARNLEGKGNR